MDTNRLIAERLVHNRMKSRLSEDSTVPVSTRIRKQDTDEEMIYLLRKINTEASEALYQYEQMDNARECRDILYYLVRDSKSLLDKIKVVVQDRSRFNESIGSAPARNSSSTLEEKLEYAKELLYEAKETNDSNIAWELIDFLYDTELLDQYQLEEKLEYAKELLYEAKETNDSSIAWELIDFLYDTELLDQYHLDEDLSLDDDPEETDQKYSSAATSINSSKLPALFKMVKFERGSINLDYGGGRFDNVAEYLESEYGATNLVYDKYNRTADHNRDVLAQIRKNGGADTVTCSNVLNVIAEESERLAVLRNCKRYLKSGGTCYITVYEGTGTGEGAPTKSGYQLNRKTKDYEDEIKQVFSSVVRRGKLFICH